jgi:hypothetical protein
MVRSLDVQPAQAHARDPFFIPTHDGWRRQRAGAVKDGA